MFSSASNGEKSKYIFTALKIRLITAKASLEQAIFTKATQQYFFNMNKNKITKLLLCFLGVGCFALLCYDSRSIDLQQSPEGNRLHPVNVEKIVRMCGGTLDLPATTSIIKEGITDHLFYGISGSDFYILSITNTANVALTFETIEYYNEGEKGHARKETIPPHRTITKLGNTRRKVSLLRVSIKNASPSGTIALATGMRQ